MKIGILTLPLYTNYGGILQAYALQTTLERMGHEVFEIEQKNEYYPCHQPLYKLIYLIPYRLIKKYIFRVENTRIFVERYYNNEVLPNLWKITYYTDQFIEKYIHRERLASYDDVDKLQLDAIVVGSDQIWRPKYIKNNIFNAYLQFTEKWSLKRISYAASFGSDFWEYNERETQICSKLIQAFDAVSVREKNAVYFCNEMLGRKDAVQVLDPTLLLNKEDYVKLLSTTTLSKGNLMVYVLDKTIEIMEYIKEYALQKRLVLFETNSNVENVRAPIEERVQPPLEQWLKGFYDAEMIITDSFHACVFSIIFRKPFYVIANKSRGLSRIESLLAPLGLMNRIIDMKNISFPKEDLTIDYELVHEKLQNARFFSIKYLTDNLK